MSDFQSVAKVDEVGENEAIIVSFGRLSVLVFNLGGEYYAIEDRCSHADVELSGGSVDLEACTIQCPKHGAKFDIKTGVALSPPAVMPVFSFDVRVEGDEIQIARRSRKG